MGRRNMLIVESTRSLIHLVWSTKVIFSSTKLIIIRCPFVGCISCFPSTNLIRDHLPHDHPNDLNKISPSQWQDLDLHFCHQCNKNIFKSKGFLTRHILNAHHSDNKNNKNLTRLLHYIPTPPSSTYKWGTMLPWIHNLNIEAPPFRQNIWL